jgi:hypothetical protein
LCAGHFNGVDQRICVVSLVGNHRLRRGRLSPAVSVVMLAACWRSRSRTPHRAKAAAAGC